MRRFPAAIVLAALPCAFAAPAEPETPLRFAITAPGAPAPITGRVLLMISSDDSAEPRFQISDGPKTQQVFGIDVAGLGAGRPAVVDGATLGYPLESLGD